MAPGRKLTKAELERELELCRKTCRNHWLGKSFVSFFRVVMWVGIAYVCYLSIQAMAGKVTTADINLNAGASFSRGDATSKPDRPIGGEKRPGGKAQGEEKSADCVGEHGEVSAFLPSGWANILCLVVGFGGLVYGRLQARFRRDVVERYHPYMVQEQQGLDPGRRSSEMPARGGTRPEDE